MADAQADGVLVCCWQLAVHAADAVKPAVWTAAVQLHATHHADGVEVVGVQCCLSVTVR